MRLVYLHQYFVRPDQPGGTRSYEFARRLASRGWDVHVVTSDRTERSSRGWKTEELEGFTVHTIPVEYSQNMSYFRRAMAFFEFAVKSSWRARKLRGDVVFATSTPLTIAVPGIFATAFRRSPLVFEVRDLWPEMPIAMGALKNPILRAAARGLERVAYAKSAAVVALSPEMRRGVLRVSGHSKDVAVIPNSSDVELFSVPAESGKEWRRGHPQVGERPFALYAGSLGKMNGLEYLVQVAQELAMIESEVAIVLVGKDGSEKEALRNAAMEARVLGDNFFLLPQVPKQEIPEAYSAATISLSTVLPLPEAEANSANKFFDGLAAGKPVVINYGGWQKQVLEEAGAGMVIPVDDPAEAARQIDALCTDGETLKAMGAASKALAEDRFSRDRLAGQLHEVLRRVGSSQRRRKPRRPTRRAG